MDDDAKAWVKLHKREFIERLISDAGAEEQDKPSAFFMAGLPGAGKTEFSKNFIKETRLNLVRIDMDEIASGIEGYTPEKADNFRFPATILMNEIFSYIIHHRFHFIMDGTFGSPNAFKNLERVAKRGYEIKVFFIYQDPKLAWQFTVARGKIEHRAISFDGFITAYYKTLTNIKTLGEKFPDVSMDLVVKTEKNTVGGIYENINPQKIDDYIKIKYNEDELIKCIEGE